MELIRKYFDLSTGQQRQFEQLHPLYELWNAQINVISRKDMDNFYERHVLHSLAIAKVLQFVPQTKILDVGTGGGFPGIPLAIMFPETQFLLVDSIGKKIKVVNEVAKVLKLKNVSVRQTRAESVPGSFDFVVSRAVTAMPDFVDWVSGKISKQDKNSLQNGILALKGGALCDELRPINGSIRIFEIESFFEEPFFETKKVVHVSNW